MLESVNVKKMLCCLSVVLLTLSLVLANISASSSIYGYLDANIKANLIYAPATSDGSSWPSLSSIKIYDDTLGYISITGSGNFQKKYTKGYFIVTTASFNSANNSAFNNAVNDGSNMLITILEPLLINNNLWAYVTKITVSSGSSPYEYADNLGVSMYNNQIWVFYGRNVNDAQNTSLQFNLKFEYDCTTANNVAVNFGVSAYDSALGTFKYNSTIMSLNAILQRMIALENLNIDISDLVPYLDLINSYLLDLDNHVDDINVLVDTLNHKVDDILAKLDIIDSRLVDDSDGVSWLSKIYNAIIDGNNTVDTSKIDDSKTKLDNLDNAIDTSQISDNISSFDDIKAPNISGYGNKWLFWQRQIDTTFNGMSGSLVDSDGFKLLWSIPLLLLVIGLVL